MINIASSFVASKSKCLQTLTDYVANFYEVTSMKRDDGIKIIRERLFENLVPNVRFHIEYPYVDKMYRDTFYHYYSSKNNDYNRNSVKISIFRKDFKEEDLLNEKRIKECYLGFFTLRPTFPNIFGRNLLHPHAFKNIRDISICNSMYSTTFDSLKLNVCAFPHSSQDSEAITCAETTIWSIIEYFSNKYSDYKPLLPNQIHEILRELTVERQIPSQGLSADQISFALKKCGFGVKVYNKGLYSSEFFKILRTYINSGIPIVAIVFDGDGICHAFNIIGKRNPTIQSIESVQGIDLREDSSLMLFDLIDADEDIVMIDDNCAPYRIGSISSPCVHYNESDWQNCEITDIIVPLYHRIYMDAGQAKKIVNNYIKLCTFAFSNREIYIKTFLCSSRSYKDYLFGLKEIGKDLKNILLGLSMPKFIWVTEIYGKDKVVKDLVEGVIIVDATEPVETHVIGAIFENHLMIRSLVEDVVYDLKKLKISLGEFPSYKGNLTKF